MKLAVMFAALAVNVASGAVVDFPGVPWSELHVDVASGHAEVLDKSGRKVLSFLPSPRTMPLDGLVLRLEKDHLAIDLRAPASRGLKALVMRGHSAEGRDALGVGKPCTHLAEWEGSKGSVIDMYLEGEDAATGKHFFSCRPCGMGGRRRILSQLTCTPEKFGWFAFRYDIVKFGNGLFRYYGARAAPQGELDPDRPALPKHPPELIFHADFDGSASAKSSRGDMVAWPQLDGADRSWEALRPTALKKGKSHTFVQVKCVKDTEDGLNVKLRVQGFGGNDFLDVEEVRIVKLMEVRQSGRAKALSSRGITAREGTVRETVRGEDAVVCRTDAYAFAHAVVQVPRILPDEKLVFTLRATLPEGAKTGQIGAILYRQKNGGWVPGPQPLWNRRPTARGWENIEFSVSGAQLGKKSGKYLLILFKMKNTDAVAVSSVSWKVTKR